MKMETLEAAPGSAPAKTSIQVIERMMALLDALANYSDPVSLKELSKVSGLHPSTAHRILNDMVVTRFVDRVEPGTYRLGMRLLELGNVVKSRLSVREAALGKGMPSYTSQQAGAIRKTDDGYTYLNPADFPKDFAADLPLKTATFESNAQILTAAKVFSTPLTAGENGKWTTKLALPPGRYRYRFVVDGKWTNDPHNGMVETNEYGELNNIVEVAA